MVMLWSTLATRDVRLAEAALSRRRPAPAPTSWVTYVRCHDDIGWAVTDADAAAAGLDGAAHRRFLSDFYAGRFPGSFSRGALFQDNPATGDSRISGMTASLCGIEAALATGDARRARPPPSAGWNPCTPWPSPSAASRSSTWATSWPCATIPAGPGTRRTSTTTGGCTGRHGLGRGRAAA